ncbi:MAG TPA: AAA family ATPase [Oscillatoriaceae cyanobacterium M33_DOE_052]|uniref:GAF domain-containing protein n=1 Tax=Planktothricoides sp. SpSt-374 TaxID=2282167 RepID=A0A7C3ZVE1_9CYAN|nr:AAA family ATPase [Oscillatoriaceae cyanobacterium M33_DOE_052]
MVSIPGIIIQSQIYESANSRVYRGIRQQDNQPVIIKILHQDYPSPQELARYRREYEITKSLHLKSVVKSYGLQKYQNTLVMLLEDFGGESLKSWMQQESITIEKFLPIAIATTEALAQIHAENIIHKDINLSNIVFNPATRELKIIDFGIATKLTRTHPTINNPSILEGTLPYMSPEQTGRMNRSLDYRSDFYSLGVSFYELLTKELPFTTTDPLELVHCHIAKQPLPPGEVNPAIPPVIGKIVLKLMAKNAEDRYQSAFGIKADLEKCLHQLHTTGQISDFPLASADISETFQLPQKLYGREREIAALLTAFDRVLQNSEMMLIGGYSGIGKSVLVQELYKPITEKRGYFIAGKFDQYQRNIPYSAVVSAFQGLVKQILTESDIKLQQWRQELLAALGNNGQVIAEVIPEIELIVGPQPPVAKIGVVEAQNRFNLVFQNFLKVLATPQHPLAIFLDDLQWADGASLKLMQLLMSGGSRCLFFIGAYRDNEVSATHPLLLTLDEMAKNGAIINGLLLSALELPSIIEILSETLNSSADRVKPLAELILVKTGGNPFFMNEFLKSLYAEKLIFLGGQEEADNLSASLLDAARGEKSIAHPSRPPLPGRESRVSETISRGWQWDLEEIQRRGFTDNVVELMAGKIQKLPYATQNLLKLAACIGNHFDLETLGVVGQISLPETVMTLQAAVAETLVMPLGNMGDVELAIVSKEYFPSAAANAPTLPKYKFLHDRIQQAAYSLIPDGEKTTTHYQIGQLLLGQLSPDHQDDRLFAVVHQLNYGIELITDQIEKDTIAQLNLTAARKARAATAYQAALEYAEIGITLLGAASWQRQYHTTLSLHELAAELAALSGKFDLMNQWVDAVIYHARTTQNKVRVYLVKVQALIAQNQLLEAIAIGVSCLQEFGLDFPANPTAEDIQAVVQEINALIGDRPVEELFHLPVMVDPEKLDIIQMASGIISACYMASSPLFPILLALQVKLSLQYGNSPNSPFSYAGYGVFLSNSLQDVTAATQFRQLAYRLASEPDAQTIRAATFAAIGVHLHHRQCHLRETLAILQAGYQAALATGNLEFAGHTGHGFCLNLYWCGEPLAELESQIRAYRQQLLDLNQLTTANYCSVYWETTTVLLGNPQQIEISLTEPAHEEKLVAQAVAAKDFLLPLLFYISRAQLRFFSGEIALAAADIAAARNYLPGGVGYVCEAGLYFYDSLISLANVAQHPQELEAAQQRIAENQIQLEFWAKHAPMNYLHKWQLVAAEKHRVLGENATATELYEAAINGAKENGYIQEAALAYELAAKFYLSQGKQLIARAYMQEARYCYQIWGSGLKVTDLETRYSELLTASQSRIISHQITTTAATTTGSTATLDIATVMKAARSISGEIVLERLLSSLMQILIENAGAQKGYLILPSEGKLLIEAASDLDAAAPTVLHSLPVENSQLLPEAIINYVARTQESVVLNDAARQEEFTNDAYIQAVQPKSVLCSPLVNQGKLISLVYLENNLTTGAFTPERLEILQLLSAQAAISIENAKLYSQLEDYNRTLEQKVAARTTELAAAYEEINLLNQRLKAENIRMAAELDVTRQLQQMILPKAEELSEIQPLEIAGFMEPADEVGGDYYDILQQSGQIKIAIGDVTGHGLEAGLLMIMAQTAVRTLLESQETDQVKFLDILNRTLYKNLARMNSAKHMTLALLDYCDGTVAIAGQHEEVLVVRGDGEIELIDTIDLGFPIGLELEISQFISQTQVKLNPGDGVVLYTDGITEASNMAGEQYGRNRLCQVVKNSWHQSAQAIRQAAIEDLRQHIGEQKVFDDITLVVLKQK